MTLRTMADRILITGATGTIGRALVKLLKEKNAQFVAGVSNSAQVLILRNQGIRAVEINFADKKLLVEVMKDTDVVLVSVPLVEFMVDWAKNIIAAASDAAVKYVVRISGIGADANSVYALMKSHGLIDRFVKESGIRHTILRPNTFMQNFSTYHAASVKDDGVLQLPQGYGKTSYVDARDVARVAAEILMEPERYKYNEYDITGDSALSNNDVAGILSSVTGKHIRYVPIEDSIAIKWLRTMGMSEWMIESMMSLHRYTKDGRAATVAKTVKEITGVYPVTMEQFVKEFARVWKSAS